MCEVRMQNSSPGVCLPQSTHCSRPPSPREAVASFWKRHRWPQLEVPSVNHDALQYRETFELVTGGHTRLYTHTHPDTATKVVTDTSKGWGSRSPKSLIYWCKIIEVACGRWEQNCKQVGVRPGSLSHGATLCLPLLMTLGESLDMPSPSFREKAPGMISGVSGLLSLLLPSFLSGLFWSWQDEVIS